MSKGKKYSIPMICEWELIKTDDLTGEVLQYGRSGNIVTRVGKEHILRLLFNDSGTPFLYGAAGPCDTAADVDDVKLTYELIGNVDRKDVTTTSELTLPGNLVYADNDETISGCEYNKMCQVQYKFVADDPDGNLDQPFREYGLVSAQATPATPTTQNGNLFNHYVHSETFTLTSGSTITARITIKI